MADATLLWNFDPTIDDGECPVPYQVPPYEITAHRWVGKYATKQYRVQVCVACGHEVKKPWRRGRG